MKIQTSRQFLAELVARRQMRVLRASALTSILAAAFFAASAAHGATATWTATDAPGNINWSDLNNFGGVTPSGNDVVFTNTGASTTAGTVTNIVDTGFTINSLTYNNVGTATHTTQINSGQTLTINGALAGAFQVNSTTAGNSNVTLTGAGTLAVTGGQTTTSFLVGASAAGAASTQTLNMGGLANFTANVATFGLGTGQRNTAVVTLAAANSITATSVALGGNITTGGPANTTLNLGQTNTINSNTITVGGGRTGGVIQFLSTLTGPTVTIANTAGTGAANLNIGLGNTNASGIGSGTVDFSLGTVNANLGTVSVGQSANAAGAGSSTSFLTMGLGTITATTVNLGLGNTGTSTTATGTGTLTMNANAGTFTATTVNLGIAASASNNGTGVFTQNGGTATLTTLNLGNRTSTGTASTSATYNLTGGTLRAGTIQVLNVGTGTGTNTTVFNFNGGTIENLNAATDLNVLNANPLTITLGGAANGTGSTFLADAGRTITVTAAMGGAGGFTKAGAGTLVLNNPTGNFYSGTTNFNAGTTNINGLFALGGANYSGVAFNGGTLQYAVGTGGAFNTTLGGGDISNFGGAKPVTINAGGATIDTNNNNVAYASTIGNSGTGALTKTGAGMLTLSAANTYSGGTNVNAGTLAVTVDGALATGNVTIAANANLTLATGVTAAHNASTGTTLTLLSTSSVVELDGAMGTVQDTVQFLIVNGVTELAGTYGSAASGAANVLPEFVGTGVLLVTVPEPSTWALLFGGVVGLTAMSMRRRRCV